MWVDRLPKQDYNNKINKVKGSLQKVMSIEDDYKKARDPNTNDPIQSKREPQPPFLRNFFCDKFEMCGSLVDRFRIKRKQRGNPNTYLLIIEIRF